MITGIILASGLSRRMQGKEKLLLPVDGLPMVGRVMRAAAASHLDEILLVYREPAVGALAGSYRIRAVHNPDAHLGQSASVKAGVRAAAAGSRAYMFLTGDQPRLEAGTVNLLIGAWREHPGCIIVPVYAGRRGSPTVFPAVLREKLLALQGDSGGRAVMEQEPEKLLLIDMPCAEAGIDIDTPGDYEALDRL